MTDEKEEEKNEKNQNKKEGKFRSLNSLGIITSAKEIVGYMPKRGDFENEYDNEAELILADMEFFEEDSAADRELKF
jgi:transcriptional adapter 2-alpha